MSKKDNRSVAYLFNEMDPAEKLEFERDLNSDSNLLIEVETLRNVTDRLKSVGEINPPSHIIDAVCNVAFQNSGANKKTGWRPSYFAAAAMLLIGMTSGIFLLDSFEKKSSSGQANEAAAGTPSFYDNSLINSAAVIHSEQRVAPWVDKNEVLHIHDRVQNTNISADSIFYKSYQKLTPVTDPAQARFNHRNLQLTGSRR